MHNAEYIFLCMFLQLPFAELWFRASNKLYKSLMKDQVDSRMRPHINTLKSMLDVDIRFSER